MKGGRAEGGQSGRAGGEGISWWTCAALVSANMIGTGVFVSIGFQVLDLPSGFVIMVLWVLGGLLALAGVLAYSELALALPRSGGEYHFLGRIYHPAVGLMGGLASALVGFAVPVALAAMALGTYAEALWPGLSPTLAGVPVVLLVALAHVFTLRAGAVFQLLSTALKLGLIGVFIVCGFVLPEPTGLSVLPGEGDMGLIASGSFAVALMYVLYAYSGWNAAIYVIGEVRDPRRQLLPGLLVGTVLVMVLYTLLNYVFLRSTPMAELGEMREGAGVVAASHVFGEEGGRLMAGLICLGLVSTISAMTWVGPRVLQTMGEDLRPLRFFAHRSGAGLPVRAVVFQTGLALVLLVTGTFEAILVATEFTLSLCVFGTVLGVIVLRVREPELERPFRCPGYPVVPALFLIVIGFTLYQVARVKPYASLVGLAIVVVAGLITFLPMVWRGGDKGAGR